MSNRSSVKKIAVLGGGVSAMTAAFELTSAPNWQDAYELTVYQMGWRLGGKGASGRNLNKANRIEEHGFHFWWGFYDNAFQMIQDCYEALNRPLDRPLATWSEAFKPFDYLVYEYFHSEQWRAVPVAYPRNDLPPGQDFSRPIPTRAEYISLIINQLLTAVKASRQAAMTVDPPLSLKMISRLPWWKKVLREIQEELGDLGTEFAIVLLAIAHRLAVKSEDDEDGLGDKIRYEIIEQLLHVFIEALWLQVKDEIGQEQGFEDFVNFVTADVAIAIARGMINDDVINKGFNSVNQTDLREWLKTHGAKDITLKSSIIRFVYDEVFAYENGDQARPSIETGTALRFFLRSLFTYKGAFIWRMEAGMGDTIFAPLYEVLKNRGVQFKFFHRVEELQLSDDKSHIAAIRITRQVDIKDGVAYQPLVNIKGLPCWPAEPLAEQIVDGERLKETIDVDGQTIPKYDLESHWTPWPNANDNVRLEVGKAFDIVVLGISLGALPGICHELVEAPGDAGDRWRQMVTQVKTTQTQAFQLWLKPDNAGLGWPLWQRPLPVVMTGYDTGPELVDAWADMSHLIIRESWPDEHYPNNIAYLVSVLKDPGLEHLPSADKEEYPLEQFKRVKENGRAFLERSVKALWPDATSADGANADALNWDLLVDLANGQGQERLNSQFWRANIDPSERYVQAVVGSSQYRLRTDKSGYDNLYLTGDWIYNGANAGYVDSAVISGMLTSQAITTRLLGKPTPEKIVGWPED